MTRWAARVLLLGFGLACAALLASAVELAYRRVATGSFASPRGGDMWVRDPDLLYRLNPDHPDTPGSFRGGAPAAPRSTRHRVVCLGGSTTFGHGVSAQRAWPAALQQELASRGVDAEVVNAGVPGYGSRQVRLRYERELAALGSEVVILTMGWNRTGALLDPHGFVPAGVARPAEDAFAAGWLRLQHAVSHRSLLLRRALSRFEAAEAPLRPWRRDPFEDAWADDIRGLIAAIQARGQQPLVVLYPSMLHAGMTEADLAYYRSRMWRKRAYQPGMLEELERKHALLRALAAERGVRAVDLQGALAGTTGAPRLAFFLDNMHPSVYGNRWIAGELAPHVAALLAGGAPRGRLR